MNENLIIEIFRAKQNEDCHFKYAEFRKNIFVDGLGWDLTNYYSLEFDCYDTDSAVYITIKYNDKIVAGMRAHKLTSPEMPFSTLTQDAVSGRIDSINLSLRSPLETNAIDCTRLAISSETPSHIRNKSMILLFEKAHKIAGEYGCKTAYCLAAPIVKRKLGQLGYSAKIISDTFICADDPNKYCLIAIDY